MRSEDPIDLDRFSFVVDLDSEPTDWVEALAQFAIDVSTADTEAAAATVEETDATQ